MTTISISIPSTIDAVDRPEGTPWGAEALADSLLTNAARITEFSEEAASLSSTTALWIGSAATAYTEHASRFAKKHEPMGETLKRVARGVDTFAEQLRTLRSEHTDLTNTIRSYHGYRSDLIADVNAATDATEDEIEALRERARFLHRRQVDIHADITAFTERVTANEKYLVELFTGADTAAEASSPNGGVGELALAAIGRMPSAGDATKMAKWWESLSEEEQSALLAAYPERLGSADGLPASARDTANRTLLEFDLADLEEQERAGTLSADEKQRLKNARATQEALEYADKYKVPGTDDRPGGMLWLYDPDAFGGDGRVAVALGDLDTASDVSVQVPGIRTEMEDVADYTKEAANLYESARYNGDGSSVATMFWLGYDAPTDWYDHATATEARAKDGGERLATAVDGLRASRSDNPAHMTAIGHSYGSTTTSYAAAKFDLAVDDVALIGSPGAGPANTASDFSVGAGHVYDGRNSRDLVAFLGDEGWARKDWVEAGLGVDPSSEDFGAKRFEAESIHRGGVRNVDDHSRYYDRDSESLYNLGRIVDGQGDDIVSARQSYDPWWRPAVDPEKDRTPTANEYGRSDTGVDQ